MATSGTSTFNLDIDEIIEEASERAGLGRAYSGNDYKTARRSLNLLSQEFANRGINLWTVEDTTLTTSVWDTSNWDQALWGGGQYLPYTTSVTGSSDIGRTIAIALRGTADGKTTLLGWDLAWKTARYSL